MKKIFYLLLMAVLAAALPARADNYIFGDLNVDNTNYKDWDNPSNGIKFGGSGQSTLELNVTSESWFRIYVKNNQYGPESSDNNKDVSSGLSGYSMTNNHGSRSFRISTPGTYIITLGDGNGGGDYAQLSVTKKTPQTYTVYFDVSEAKTKKSGFGTEPFAHVWGYGVSEEQKLALSHVTGDIWKLQIPNATSKGNVIILAQNYFYGDNDGNRKYSRTDELTPENNHLYKLYVNGDNWWLATNDQGEYKPEIFFVDYPNGTENPAASKFDSNNYLAEDAINHSTDTYFRIKINGVYYGATTADYELTKSSNPQSESLIKNSNNKFVLKKGFIYKITISNITADKPTIRVEREVKTYTYKLKAYSDGGSGEEYLALTPGVPVTSTSIAGKKFGIQQLEGANQAGWFYAPTVSAVEEGLNTYDLVRRNTNANNGSDFQLPSREGTYTFTLNVDEWGLPASITVDAPKKMYYLTLVGNANFFGETGVIGDWGQDATWANNDKLTRSSDTGEFFFYAQGNFNISTAELPAGTRAEKQTAFNKSAFKIASGSTSSYGTQGNITWDTQAESTLGSSKAPRWVYIKFTDDKQATAIIQTFAFPWVYYRSISENNVLTVKQLTSAKTPQAPFYWNNGQTSLANRRVNFRVISGTSDKNYGARLGEDNVSALRSNLYSLAVGGNDLKFPNTAGVYSFVLNLDEDNVATGVNITPPDFEYVIRYGEEEELITPGQELVIGLKKDQLVSIAYRLADDDEYINFGPSSAVTTFDTKNVQTHSLTENSNYFKVPATEGDYSFVLTPNTDATPRSLQVTPPSGYLFIGGKYDGKNNIQPDLIPSLIAKTDGEYPVRTIVVEKGDYFRFYSSDKQDGGTYTQIGPAKDYNIGGTISSELTASEGQTALYKFTSEGVYNIQVTDFFLGTVKFRITKQAITRKTPETLYYRAEPWDKNNDVKLMDKSADGKVFKYKLTGSSEGTRHKFNFKEKASDNWTGFTVYPATDALEVISDVVTSVISNQTPKDPGTAWVYNSISSDPITFMVDYTDADNPTLFITQRPSDVDWADNAQYWLHARFNDNWNSEMRTLFVPTDKANPTTQTLTTTYREFMTGNQGFKVTNEEKSDAGKFYTVVLADGETKAGRNTAYALSSDLSANTVLTEDAINQPITLTLELNADYTPKSLTAKWEDNKHYDYTKKDFKYSTTEEYPVYPRGIYTKKDMYRYQDWPCVYLRGKALNNERITPEYQMTKIADDHYELIFTYRPKVGDDKQDVYVTGFDNPSGAGYEVAKIAADNVPDDKIKWDDGARYRAICKRSDSTGEWVLTLEPEGSINDLPFVSILGATWKQETIYNTPQSGQTTDTGWQESWIQYDNNGKVLKDRNGKVMYNTMWPPRNPIFFSTKFKLEGSDTEREFTLKSSDLIFDKIETKKGSEWKADPMFAEYEKENLSDNNGYTGEHNNVLALNDDDEYTLYRASNVWVTGPVKLWTGWAGIYDSNDKGETWSRWNDHWNWGYWQEHGGDKEFDFECTIPLNHWDANIKYVNPTFCKHIDFFYDAAHSHDQGRCVLFTEKAFGGAQISAMADAEHKYGNFQAGLTQLGNIPYGELKKVVINAYATIGESSAEEIVGNVFTWSADQEATPHLNKDFHTLFSGDEWKVKIDDDDNVETVSSTESITKYLYDGLTYTAGDYFYRMTVVLTDNEGKEHTEVVESNPFTIVGDANITLNAYQLVKIDDQMDKNGKWTGHYWTYKTQLKDQTNAPILPVYELWIENDDKYDPENRKEYLDTITGNLKVSYIDDSGYKFTYKALDELPDYSAQDIQFTDKMLLVGSVPGVDKVVGYKFEASRLTEDTNTPSQVVAKVGPMKAPASEVYDKFHMQSEYGDRFMSVANVENFNNREFTLTMGYTNIIDGEETGLQVSDKAKAQYAAVIPTPVMKEAKIDVIDSKPQKNEEGEYKGVKDFKFSIEGSEFTLSQARYHTVRDHIEVHFPNASTFLTDRIELKNFFSIKLTNEDPKNDVDDPMTDVWNNIFKFVDAEDNDVVKDENDKTIGGLIHGHPMSPVKFSKNRFVKLEKQETVTDNHGETSDPIQYYDRWEDGTLTPLLLTDNAPIEIKPEMVEFDSESLKQLVEDAQEGTFYHTEGEGENATTYIHGEVIGKKNLIYVDNDDNWVGAIRVKIKHDENYTPNPAATDLGDALDEEHDKHNYIFHEGKADFQHIEHHSPFDYYYVTVINDKKHEDHESDAHDCIISGKYSADELKLDENNKMEFVVSAFDLLGKDMASYKVAENDIRYSNGQGLTVTVRKVLGKKSEITEEAVTDLFFENHPANDLKVLVSYLYPFDETTTATTNAGKRRVVKNYEGAVLKSAAASADLGDIDRNSYITTGISGIYNDAAGYIHVGEGYIEVEGTNVMIYTPAGIKIAEGAGRHNLVTGVYVVTYNGRTEKVVVK